MTPDVKDFPALVRWLADTYHRGTIMHVGAAAGISQATADKWVKGRVIPTIDMLEKLCVAYRLDFHKVVDLVRATKRPKLRVTIASLVLLLTAAGGVLGWTWNPLSSGYFERNAHYRQWRKRRYGCSLPLAATTAA